MVKIKLSKAFEIDNKTFEDWCLNHKVGKWKGRVYIREKIYDLGEKCLKKEGLK